MFSFSYDANRRLLHIVQQGYWTIEEFRDFEQAFLAHHRTIELTHNSYRVLADCRDYPVQSPEVGEAFATLFRMLMDQNHGHYAIVIASMLNKVQARRVIPQSNVGLFAADEWDRAMAWLFEDGSLPG
ncbi:hypothetical protein U5A82_05730 [Sphingobium sp. CR2-8]|uniref:hypothetical protein n=1 Tax=Sphingobium sp. CR2-8 TaxID=1306534 RepID=UPI002DB9B777|nr:hypothetical protein [Sphingobium sp. CR2-8]MEC3909991.1 hypothetical protein [Sphingobium sp. CR2-8]